MGSKNSNLNILYIIRSRFDRAVKQDFLLNLTQINKHMKELKEAPSQLDCMTVLPWQEYTIRCSETV